MLGHRLAGSLFAFWCCCSNAFAADLILPNLQMTPGSVRQGLSLKRICEIKWGKDARHVTQAMKNEIFTNYGLSGNTDPRCIADQHGRKCEIDHLISRELGGADEVRNLWPEPYGTHPWNAQLKDRLENRLHKEVCEHRLSLKKAREEIQADWRVPYRRYFGDPP